METERRIFIGTAAAAIGIAALTPFSKAHPGQQSEEIPATEDLMREHGVLNRVLLIYEEGLRRLREKQEVTPEVFRNAAQLIRRFVEDYHERLEERFIFPEFEKQKRLVDLVTTLRQQHDAGRRLTDVILRHATGDRFGKADSRQEIRRACEAFIRMYRPHEAREDFRLCGRSCLLDALKNLENNLKKKKTDSSAKAASKKRSSKLPKSKSNWVFTT